MSGEEAAIVIGAAALSLAGVAIAMAAASTARRIADLVGMAGGVVILVVAVLHLAPDAISAGGTAPVFFLAGVVAGVVLELLFHERADPAPATVRAGAWLGVLLLAIHSTLDGALYTAVFWHRDGASVVAALGLIVHEAPEGVVAMMLALQAGLRTPAAAGVAVLASSLTTPLGWVLAHAIGESASGAMQAMFAASAGLLLYVGWHLIAHGWKALRANPSVGRD